MMATTCNTVAPVALPRRPQLPRRRGSLLAAVMGFVMPRLRALDLRLSRSGTPVTAKTAGARAAAYRSLPPSAGR